MIWRLALTLVLLTLPTPSPAQFNCFGMNAYINRCGGGGGGGGTPCTTNLVFDQTVACNAVSWSLLAK
jgi:hypothetical protein